MAEVHSIAKARRSRCPICRKPTAPDFRPFCSARCKTLDLGRWLGGTYRVPTDEEPEEGEPAAAQRPADEET